MAKHTFVAGGSSDDIALMTGTEDAFPGWDREYKVPGRWFECLLDGKVIGRCRIVYQDNSWDFVFESDEHALRAGRRLNRSGLPVGRPIPLAAKED